MYKAKTNERGHLLPCFPLLWSGLQMPKMYSSQTCKSYTILKWHKYLWKNPITMLRHPKFYDPCHGVKFWRYRAQPLASSRWAADAAAGRSPALPAYRCTKGFRLSSIKTAKHHITVRDCDHVQYWFLEAPYGDWCNDQHDHCEYTSYGGDFFFLKYTTRQSVARIIA